LRNYGKSNRSQKTIELPIPRFSKRYKAEVTIRVDNFVTTKNELFYLMIKILTGVAFHQFVSVFLVEVLADEAGAIGEALQIEVDVQILGR
jgi:hypothetical protein